MKTERYTDTKGRARTAAQLEQELRLNRLRAGATTSGPDYDKAVTEYIGAHNQLTKKDERSISAATITFAVIFGASALIAMITLMTGGIVASLVILIVGALIAFGVAALVVMFTSLGKR